MQTMKRSLAMFMVLIMLVAFVPALSLGASAAEVDYQYSGKYIYNWGTRGVTATFLSPNAEDFYEDNNTSYAKLSSYSGGTGKSDAPNSEIYRELQSLMKSNHNHTNSYKDNNSLLKYTDCQNGGGAISSFYSGKSIGPNWDSASTWNKEHTWPNSKGLGGSDEDDVMMIRPTSVSENSSRGNTAYGQSSGYYNPNKESGGKYDLRGDVARIFLYVYVRWGNTSYAWGTGGVMESVDVLLAWMEEDPVDTWELGRNDSVESITGTRNVFVDYPELAFILFGEEIPENMTTPSGEAGKKCNHNNFGTGVVTVATCTENGYTLYTCQVAGCGYSYKDNIVEATGHNYVSDVCSVCGEKKATEPSPNSTITIEQAITIGDSKEHNTTTTDKYYISGVVKEIKNTTYGNMYIQDGSGNSIYVYGTYSADGSTRYDAMSVKPVAGDTVTLYGVVGNYNGAQIKNAWLVAHTPATPEVTTPEVTTPADNPTTPPIAGEATISFADKANRTEFSTSKQVWKQNGITVTNDKASASSDVADYANPVRFYQGSNVTISYPNMTKIVLDCHGLESKYVGSWLNVTNATATNNNGIITIEFNAPVDSITFTSLAKQSRAYSITVYAEVQSQPEETTPEVTTPEEPSQPEETTPEVTTPEEPSQPGETTPEMTTPEDPSQPEVPDEQCKHTNTTVEGVIEPTCTTAGHTGSTVCADCGEIVNAGEEIPATEHTMAEWIQVRTPNCTTDGLERRDCDNCPYYETKAIAALGHNDADNDGICDTCKEEATKGEETTPDNDNTEEHICQEVSGFKAFINAIINFFRKLFGQPQLCPCGETFLKEE